MVLLTIIKERDNSVTAFSALRAPTMTWWDRLGARSADLLQAQVEGLTRVHVLEITEGSSNLLEVACARTVISQLMVKLIRILPRTANLMSTFHA